MVQRRRQQWIIACVVVVVAVVVILVGRRFLPDSAAPPGPTGTASSPADLATAKKRLGELVLGQRGPMTGYSRDRFPHWSTVEGKCDTRETVLKRDGKDVKTDAECRAISGSWTSPYDGKTWTQASDVDIDHMVPLAQSWRSGAAGWTDEVRKQFANDLTNHQLLAVTDKVNQSKGDQAPDQWRPPLESSWCVYAQYWIEVKHVWKLTVVEAEKSALTDMLNRC